jgi:hypothetical protein
MSVTGEVRCLCYENGLASPPPVPVRVDERDQLQPVRDEDRPAVRAWIRSACAHPDMAEAEFDLAWRFVRSFYAELDHAGTNVYPTLLANLPRWNGAWFMTPGEAAAALRELQRFDAEHPPLRMDRLVDPSGHRHYCQTEHQGTNRFFTSALADGTPATAGLAGSRFCVWPADDPTPVFQAGVVEQRPSDDLVELTDATSGTSIRLRRAVWDGAERFRVVTLDVPAAERYLAMAQTTDLCTASVRTGHHVHWG